MITGYIIIDIRSKWLHLTVRLLDEIKHFWTFLAFTAAITLHLETREGYIVVRSTSRSALSDTNVALGHDSWRIDDSLVGVRVVNVLHPILALLLVDQEALLLPSEHFLPLLVLMLERRVCLQDGLVLPLELPDLLLELFDLLALLETAPDCTLSVLQSLAGFFVERGVLCIAVAARAIGYFLLKVLHFLLG